MAEHYRILLLEPDPQVAADISRYLRIAPSGISWDIDTTTTLPDIHAWTVATPPHAVILDAIFVLPTDRSPPILQLLQERKIPFILLTDEESATAQQPLKNLGAVAVFTKNKLNYYHLPRVLHSTLTALHQSLSNSEAVLLDRIRDALFIISPKGIILYQNIAARRLMGDGDTRSLLRRWLTTPDQPVEEMRVQVQLHGYDYQLQFAPIVWAGEAAISIQLSKLPAATMIALRERTDLISGLISTLSQPFALSVNDRIIHVNAALETLAGQIVGMDITALIGNDATVPISLHSHTPIPTLTHIGSKKLSTPHHLHTSAVAVGDDLIQLLTLLPAHDTATTTISPHRLMEIASHDLREPIRTTMSYLQLLTDGLKKEGGNKKLSGYVDTITDEMQRAERMVVDMKTLMSLGNTKVQPQRLALLPIIQEVLKQLKPSIDRTDAMVNVADMPPVMADPAEVKRVLYILLDNALKFVKKDKRPYIEILSRREAGSVYICIKDNGIGIDSQYHETIFEPFRKLNRVDEYPGAGNGLAIARYIAQSHGGRLWVESHEGFGSSFFFTLPEG